MTDTPTAMRIPESMGAAEIGPYLKELREYFKLSTQDVSERLHIRVRYVAAMEEGNFEQMPGKVYARGYVHTYAEFLGLDADQVVNQCFGEEKHAAPNPARGADALRKTGTTSVRRSNSGWTGLAVLGVFGILGLVAYTQVMRPSDSKPEPQLPTVAEVPEAMLSSIRDTVMPRAQNFDCLTGDLLLACSFSDTSAQLLDQIMDDKPFAGLTANINPMDALEIIEETPSKEDSPAEEKSHSDSGTTNAHPADAAESHEHD